MPDPMRDYLEKRDRELEKRVAELEAERDRYKTALEVLADKKDNDWVKGIAQVALRLPST